MNGMDAAVSSNGKVVGVHDPMRDIGIDHDCILRCSGRLRSGVQAWAVDVLGVWTVGAGVLVATTRLPLRPPLSMLGPLVAFSKGPPVNPTCRPNRIQPAFSSSCFGAEFSSVGPASAGWSGWCVWDGAPAVLSGKSGLAQRLHAVDSEP